MQLSKRLSAVAGLVSSGGVLADVGTDHGYIPIALVEAGRIRHALAMDINQGPLARAKENIRQHGLEEKIETRLSDGLMAMNKGEADTVLIAGMGGFLMVRILNAGKEVLTGCRELVLQPQSDLISVRTWLKEEEYEITEEDLVLEDGKYYPMMRAQKRQAKPEEVMKCDGPEEELQLEQELRYGPQLLWNKHPLLEGYLEREETLYRNVLDSLSGKNTEGAAARRAEVEHELFLIDKVRRNLSKPSVLYHSHLA